MTNDEDKNQWIYKNLSNYRLTKFLTLSTEVLKFLKIQTSQVNRTNMEICDHPKIFS